MATVQVVTGGVCVSTMYFNSAPTLVGGSLSLVGGGMLSPPSGTTYMQQDGAGVGWTLSMGVLSPPASLSVGITPTVNQLVSYATNKAQYWMQQGFTVTVGSNTYQFATDATSLIILNYGTTRLLMASPPSSINWPTVTGPNIISATDFSTASSRTFDFMLATQSALATVLDAIVATTITTYAQIELASWPAPHFP